MRDIDRKQLHLQAFGAGGSVECSRCRVVAEHPPATHAHRVLLLAPAVLLTCEDEDDTAWRWRLCLGEATMGNEKHGSKGSPEQGPMALLSHSRGCWHHCVRLCAF